jgi:signal transduction histidine kinase
MVEVLVKDNGCGIEPAYQEMIFRPYFTTKEHGTGLGLFVTRKLVEGHGGTVGMTSSPGEGTTFRVLLPLAVGKNRNSQPAVEPVDETVAHTP